MCSLNKSSDIRYFWGVISLLQVELIIVFLSFSLHPPLVDMKGSPGGSSVGKSSVSSGGLVGPQGQTEPSVESEKPEVELSNLVMCSSLSQSQSSLKSSSSIGSVRGDEGGLYADFYGDYCPLFDNGQESDSASLRGKTARRHMCLTLAFYHRLIEYIKLN